VGAPPTTLGLTGCGQPKTANTANPPVGATTAAAPTTPLELLQAAPAKTVAAKSSKMSITMKFSGDLRISAAGDGVARFDPVGSDITLTGDLTIRQLIVGTLVYIQQDGKWTKSDLSAPDAAGQSDPSALLNYLGGISGPPTRTGKTTIHGASATGYQVTIDLDQAASKANAPEKADLQDLKKVSRESTLPFQVWLDDQGRVVQMSYSFKVNQAGKKFVTAVNMALYDFGTPVTITAPKA
jgi:hypothetical protein